MTKDVIKYTALIALLPVLQAFIFNQIHLFGFVNPLIYIIIIFIFPILKDRSWILITAFVLGFLIDFITNDNGIHAFALVFVAYIRLFVLKFIKGTNFMETDSIDIDNLNLSVQVTWIVIITFIHSFIIFLLEQFSFNLFGQVLLKTFLTTILTSILLIFGIQLFMNKKTNVW